jgi:integrase
MNGLPKIIAGGLPVIPINVALQQRRELNDATDASLETYARSARLYAEFAAHLRRSILDVTNDDFKLFRRALQGSPFHDANENLVRLSTNGGKRTADLMITLMYSLAIDVEELYRVRFDWRRYRGFPDELITYLIEANIFKPPKGVRREHSIKWRRPKVYGLPDDQFDKLLCAAYSEWGDSIPNGDAAFAKNPEAQRGALFYRNTAMLLLERFGGARRSEVPAVELADIDRKNSKLYLVTKGHRGENEERLPVLLFPAVYDILWSYITRFRPTTGDQTEQDRRSVFLSHSVVNYGRRVSAQTVRKMLEAIRGKLDPPWNEILTPHMLRHSYAYDLQRYLNEVGVTVNMRHASPLSASSYSAGVEVFADLLAPVNAKLKELFSRAPYRPQT